MLNEAVKLYEQRHVLIKYLNLKIKLESITKSYSEVEKLCDDELLEYVINNIGISNTITFMHIWEQIHNEELLYI